MCNDAVVVMDRTSDFLGFVRKSKHLRDEPIKTPDLIRPTLSVDPFLVKSMHIVCNNERNSCVV